MFYMSIDPAITQTTSVNIALLFIFAIVLTLIKLVFSVSILSWSFVIGILVSGGFLIVVMIFDIVSMSYSQR